MKFVNCICICILAYCSPTGSEIPNRADRCPITMMEVAGGHNSGNVNMMTEDGEDGTIPKVLREGDHNTDIIFLVEDGSLHFTKVVLAMCSPVFHTLLTPEYIQQHSEGIPLTGKTYCDVAFFLQLMHPVYSVTPLTDDRLLPTLALAKEYQVDHISTKCEQYIGSQLELHGFKKMLTTDTQLIYLTACERHHLATHKGALVKLASEKTTHNLQASRLFELVPPTALKDVLLARSQMLEGRNSQLEKGLKICRSKISRTKENEELDIGVAYELDDITMLMDQMKC